MANAYRTKRDVSFPRVLGTTGTKENGDLVEATEGVNYAAGSIVPHATLPSFVKAQIEEGNFDHILDPVSDEEADEALEGVQDEEYGIFVPEHEAEAHALLVAGKGVVPKEQAMELGDASEEHAANYQQAVKEHGMDRRPVQEFLVEAGKERVPDEILTGRETAAGLPHNRGPEGADVPARDEQEESPGGDDRQTVRPRPPAQGENVGPEEAADRGNSDSESEERVGEA